eukprot:776184-Rhodomonas_salina.1
MEGEQDLLDLASGTEGDRDLRRSPADGSCAGALAEETFLLEGAGREDVPSEKEQVLRARGLGWPDTKSGARVDGVRWRDERLSAWMSGAASGLEERDIERLSSRCADA